MFIGEQQFDTLLVIQEGLPYVSGFNVNVANGPINEKLACHIGPVLLDNKQTVICPLPANPLTPGINTLIAEVILSDGTVLTQQAIWEMLQ